MIRHFLGLLGAVAPLWPLAVDPSEDLRRSVRFLGLDEELDTDTATVIVAGGYLTGTAVWVVSTVIALALSVLSFPVSTVGLTVPPVAVVTLPLGIGLAWVHIVHRLPVWLGTFYRTRALGLVATVVGLAALRLRLTPSPERAASFTVQSETGPLADSLARHVAAARGTPRSGLSAFAAAWRPWFPALDRATSLLLAASEASPDGRSRALDRAVATVGESVESRTATFAQTVRGPVTGLYALGVLLPLALVGAVPAAAVAGVPITPAVFVVVYDGLLPLGVTVAGSRIVLERPVAFPPP
ncbi:MAG: type II secretion system protein, partial [Halobaculum sp.]